MSMWKYASLPQRERIERIANGDSDVYKSEIARTDYIALARKKLGLDTSDADNWKNSVNKAFSLYNDRSKKSSYKANTPVYASGKANEAINEFNALMKRLSSEYDDGVADILNTANVKKNKLDEWLASNGLSQSGKIARDELSDIENELEQGLNELKSQFDKTYEKAKAALRTALR